VDLAPASGTEDPGSNLARVYVCTVFREISCAVVYNGLYTRIVCAFTGEIKALSTKII
jgi:hypothetical protein